MNSIPRWLMATFAAVLLVVLASGTWFYHAQEQYVWREAQASLQATAELKVEQIVQWRAERVGDAAVLAGNPFLIQEVAQWMATPRAETTTQLYAQLRSLQESYDYSDVLLVDAAGQVRLSLLDASEPLVADETQALARAFRTRQALLTDLHSSPGDSSPHCEAVAPLFAEDGVVSGPIGAVLLRSDARQFLYPLIQSWPTSSQSAETLLVRRDGDAVLFLSDLRYRQGAALSLRIPLSQTDVPAIMAVLGKEGIVQGKDYRGVAVVSALRAIPDSPWFIVAKEDATEVFAIWRFRSALILALVLATVATSVAVMGVIWQQRGKAHYRALLQADAARRESEERWQFALEGAGDGVWDWNVQTNRVYYSRQWKAMLGYEEDEIGDALDEWDKRIHPDDRQAAYAALDRHLAGDAPVYVSEHRVMGKDGAYRWILDRGKVISRTPEGKPLRVIGTHADITEHRRLEEALRQSETKYRGLFENALVGIFLNTPDGRPIEINPANARIFGYAGPEEMLAEVTDIAQHVYANPEDRKEVLRILAEKGVLESGEYLMRRRDGTPFWMLMAVRAIKDDTGKMLYLEGTGIDITERKLAEQALRESEEKYRALVENASEGILIAQDSVLAFANRRTSSLVGVPVEELLGTPFARYIHPDDVALVTARYTGRVAGENVPDHYDFRLVGEEGRIVWVHIAATRIEWQGRPATLNMLTDITERKWVEEALRQSEVRYRDLFQNAIVGVFRNTPDGHPIEANRAQAQMLGYDSPEEMLAEVTDIGQQFYPDPEDRKRLLESLAEKGAVGPCEYILKRRDGSPLWALLAARAVGDDSGKVLYYEGTTVDITERKRAEQALRESEEKYRTLVENMDEAISIVQDSQLVFANRRASSMLGISAEELRDAPVGKYVHPDDRALVIERYVRRAAGEDVPDRYDHRLVGEGGRVVWVYATVKRIEWQGRPATLNMFTDITERKRVEEALRDSEAFLNRMVEQSPVPMWISDDQGTLIRLNRACCDLFHISEEQVVGRYNVLQDNIVEEQGHMPAVRSVFERGQTVRFELHYDTTQLRGLDIRKPAIASLDVTIFPIKDASGRLTNAVIQDIDITERRRAEEQLVSDRNMLRTLIDNMPDLIFVKDTQSRFLVANEAIARMMGASGPGELLGKTDFDFCPRAMAEDYYTSEQELMRSGKPILDWQETNVDKQGIRRWLSTTKVRLCDSSGQVIGLVGIGRDITEHRQAQEESEKLQAQLLQAQKMETVGRLAGGIAHDFNNLLTVINGYSEILLDALSPEAFGHPELAEIHKAGERAAALTTQLLAFSRRQLMQPRILDLNEELAGMTRMLTRLIGEDIRLTFTPASSLGRVRADPSQMHQVVLNLAVNARDAMPQGGVLTLETANVTLDASRCRHDPEIEPGPYVMLAISDTGAGMSEEVKAHLFEPFFTTKGVGQGTGLGLSMVYGIIKQSGGAISVYSELGQGTTFRIYLPRVDEAPVAAEAPQAALPRGGETILLVEDSPDVRRFTMRLLQSLGYRVLEAGNGAEALALVDRFADPIHLLLTDVVMPEMSGREVAEKLVALRPTLRVLYMSGYTDNAIVHRGVLDEGMQFIPKPFRPEELAVKVRAVLDMA